MARRAATAAMLAIVGLIPVAASARPVIGVSMPNNKVQELWNADAAAIVRNLQGHGYDVDLRNARDDVAAQISQIGEMVKDGDKVLVIAPIDASALDGVLVQAAARDVKVIAFDRLISDTPHVDYYVGFDNIQVGILQAQSLLRGLHMEQAPGPFDIELFAGSPDDGNSFLFFTGAMSVLSPLIRSGRLVVRSGQTSLEAVSTLRWNPDAAEARMDNLLSAFYVGRHLDAVLSPNDELAAGIIASLQGAGYGTGGTTMAIVTGQDCNIAGVMAIIAGTQYASVFKDTRRLADVAADMVDAIVTGRPVPVNDRPGLDNGVKRVPTYLLLPALVDRDTVETLLVRSGYYTNAQLGLPSPGSGNAERRQP